MIEWSDSTGNRESYVSDIRIGVVPNIPGNQITFSGVLAQPTPELTDKEKKSKSAREKLKALGLTEDELNTIIGR